MSKLLLVDGSNLLFQMYYGMPSRIVNAQGKPIHGTLGFTGALLKMIRMVKPTHLAVLFDGEHENERTLIDADYKANRPDYSQLGEQDTPFSQLPDIYAALDHLAIRYAETESCETDDWIAAYARTYASHSLVIASFDSDFFQLITPNISVLRYRGAKTVVCDPAYIQSHFGVRPEQYADFKALTGDNADNIRGAEHVGPKTAAMLLKEFETLEQLLKHAQCISKPSIRKSITANTERLRQNARLIRLSGAVALPFQLDELCWHDQGLTTTEVLRGIHLT